MGHLNGILARVGGNLNNNFQKSQMPGWLPGGAMLKLRFDRYITSVACYEVVSSHKLVLLNEKRSYTAASIALVNGCIACICSWLLVIYILDVG